MDEITLTIAKAYPNDSGRGIARLDPHTMMVLQLTPGDIIELEGKRATSAKVWRADRIDWDQDIIRIDGFIRQNAGAGIGDHVKIKKAEVKIANKIVLAPPEGTSIQFGGEAEEMVKRQIMKRSIIKGDIIPVMSTMAHPFLGRVVTGQTIPLVAIEAEPDGILTIADSTDIKLREKPVVLEIKGTGITYEDIGGLSDEIQRLREMIELPMKHPEVFQRLGIDSPKGVLMYGPPGTGKTLIARAVANESGSNFFSIAGPEIMSKYYGESEQRLRELFEQANKEAPSIIFIDELDSIAPKREDVTGEVERRVVAQLLTMMDGLEERGQVVVIGATNRIDAIDPALRRPGRFDREVEIGVPDQIDRLEIFQIHTRGMPIYNWENDIALKLLSERISSFEKNSLMRISDNTSRMESLEFEKRNFENDQKEIKDELEKLEKEKKNANESFLQRILGTIINKQNQIKPLKSKIESLEKDIELSKNNIIIIEKDIVSINKINNTIKIKRSILESIVVDITKVKHYKNVKEFNDIINRFSEGIINQKDTEISEIEKTLLDSGVVSQDYIKKVIEDSIPYFLNKLASKTHGFVGADISALAREAAMKSLRRYIPQIKVDEAVPQEILDNMHVTADDFEAALKEVEPSAMREVLVEISEISWDDVGGLNEARQEIIEAVEWPLKSPEKFLKMGIQPPKGILLYGPPGTGKTLLAKAVANESSANFISVRGPQLLSKWVGESEKAIREVFKKARQVSPSILFLDELDAIAPVRGMDAGSRTSEKVVNQLLTELDGIETLKNVVVIGATNRPEIIDPALIRSGRFDRLVFVGPPGRAGRVDIFNIHTKNIPLAEDVNKEELADLTENYVGADIESLCREAVMLALRENFNTEKVEMSHFRASLKKVRPALVEGMIEYYEKLQEQFKGGTKQEQKSYIGYR
ncbi:MAG: CDC48 family AAA ATPase [Euryarchaeota archaeon]|nr:CDC48 family AAA ATPase [Euryarchaeota archaeon]MBU4138358.1 CDC48 family AAA ATPase [Euryarchaeota archaeon]